MKPLNIRKSYRVAFSLDGTRLASLSQDISVWDIVSEREVLRSQPLSHPSSCCFSPSGRELAVKATSGQIMIIASQSGEVLCDFKNDDDGEGSNISYSSCGDFVVDGSWAGKVLVRRAKTGIAEYVRDFPEEMITAVHRCNEGRTWILHHDLKLSKLRKGGPSDVPMYLSVWNWPFRTFTTVILQPNTPLVRAWSSAVTEDGGFLALVSGVPRKRLAIFRIADGTEISSTDVSLGGTGSHVTWSRDGKYIGSVQKKMVVIYSASSLSTIAEYPVPHPSDVAFSANGNLVALGSLEEGALFPLKV